MAETTTATPHTARHPFAPIPARPEHVDALLRAMCSGVSHDENELRYRLRLGNAEFSAALREARQAGLIQRWRKSAWYAGIWTLSDAGRDRLNEIQEQEAKVEERESVSAYAHTDVRAEIVEDDAWAYEWRLNLADVLADENALLKHAARRLNDALAEIPALQLRLLRANMRIAALEREIEALRAERATLAASEAAPAAVRMDRASQRQKTAWTPPKRNPAA